MEAGDWTWLEVAKLSVAAATPVAVAVIGLWVGRLARRVEQAQWTNRKLIERRIDAFDKMAEPLNDLYVFFRRIGNFQKITPPDALDRKRTLDRVFFVHEPLMTEEFVAQYHAFMSACFETWTGVGQDAQMKTSEAKQRRERGERWMDEWSRYFVQDESKISSASTITSHYEALRDSFAEEFGIERTRTQRSAAGQAMR